jgi:hypothetical protein
MGEVEEPVLSLDLALFIHAQHQRAIRRRKLEPDDVAHLFDVQRNNLHTPSDAAKLFIYVCNFRLRTLAHVIKPIVGYSSFFEVSFRPERAARSGGICCFPGLPRFGREADFSTAPLTVKL